MSSLSPSLLIVNLLLIVLSLSLSLPLLSQYIKYMYYSLTNKEYLTWNLTDTNLNIEYNLSIANAYFDGT